MERRWTSFNKAVTDKEFKSLPVDDRIGLFEAMKLYRKEAGKSYVIKGYGDGLSMIKPKDGQGRCLFFCVIELEGTQKLVALLAYKKEGQKAPARLIKLARERMSIYRENQK
jgi:phage-related protein